MQNKSLATLFCLSALGISLISTIMALILHNYVPSENVQVFYKTNTFIVVDKPVEIKRDAIATLDTLDTYNISVLIDNNKKHTGKIYLKVYNPLNKLVSFDFLEYQEAYQAYDVTNFNGSIDLALNYPQKYGYNWQIQLIYVDYLEEDFLRPKIIIT